MASKDIIADSKAAVARRFGLPARTLAAPTVCVNWGRLDRAHAPAGFKVAEPPETVGPTSPAPCWELHRVDAAVSDPDELFGRGQGGAKMNERLGGAEPRNLEQRRSLFPKLQR